MSRSKSAFRLVAAVLGLVLLVWLVHQAGLARLARSIETLGWGLALIIAVAGVSQLIKTWAWWLTLSGDTHHVSFGRMFALRLGSEAAGQLGFLGQVFGETLRVSLLSSTLPVASGIASVTLDRALFIITAALVSATGAIAALLLLPLSHRLSVYACVFVTVLIGTIAVAAAAVRGRWPLLSGSARALGRVRRLNAWIERKKSLIHSVENGLLDFCHHRPRAFWGSLSLNLTCHGVAVLEVYLILRFIKIDVGLIGALAIEALTKLVNIAGLINPGNVGTYEGGNMVIAKLFGLSGAVGLTLGVARRIRGLFWGAVGVVCLVALGGTGRKQNSRVAKKPDLSSRSGRSHIALVIAGSQPQMLPVGALPVLLRAIIGACKAGATRIVVVSDTASMPAVKRELLRTGRLPAGVEWFGIGSEDISLPALLAQFSWGPEELRVLIAGDRTYHPSLHRLAAEWSGTGDALALMTGSQFTGIYVVSRKAATDLAPYGPPDARSLEELDAWLASVGSVERAPVEEDKWQHVVAPEDRLQAERKLDRWLVKPTDGIFARMNRKASIPLSRLLIRFPITPNMVSLFTLGVSFLCGVFFAYGGYRNMLIGAVLGLVASVLDGCDGEVARLKLQDSAFGCWLETICDYLYYVFMFAGMTIGLLRQSRTHLYLVLGGLLLFGAVASFMVSILQRRRLTLYGRPEQFLANWHEQAVTRRSNPFLYFGRHTEFIARRCFLPYAILFFALLNITHVALILSVVGANLFWPISLYTYCTFRTVRA